MVARPKAAFRAHAGAPEDSVGLIPVPNSSADGSLAKVDVAAPGQELGSQPSRPVCSGWNDEPTFLIEVLHCEAA